MKSKISRKVFTVMLLCGAVVSLGVAAKSYPIPISELMMTVTVDSEWEFSHEPLIQEGVTYVPLREFAEYLRIGVSWDEETKKVEVDTIHKSPRKEDADGVLDVIPDKATALAVGKAILESATGQSMEYKEGETEFYLDATYYSGINEWKVSQFGTFQGKFFYGSSNFTPCVMINKSSGEVTYINLDPMAERATPRRQEDGSIRRGDGSPFLTKD